MHVLGLLVLMCQPADPPIRVEETADYVRIETDCLQAKIRKKDYVSGIGAGSFVDKKTGARDAGFGLHIMDFLLAPGWRDDGYPRDAKLHGNLPKHYVEGPQVCTQARTLTPEAKYLYQRHEGKVPARMIRAYQVTRDGKPGPWLAGMTLDPAQVSEAWCHQRGYVCFIEELHGKRVKAGESFGAAYVVGWFGDVAEM